MAVFIVLFLAGAVLLEVDGRDRIEADGQDRPAEAEAADQVTTGEPDSRDATKSLA